MVGLQKRESRYETIISEKDSKYQSYKTEKAQKQLIYSKLIGNIRVIKMGKHIRNEYIRN